MNKLKVLVTGGLGFIGSNFIQKLLIENKDYEVINIDAGLFGTTVKNPISGYQWNNPHPNMMIK